MAVNPKSLDNLKKFQAGNQHGGRKEGSISLKKSLQKIIDSDFKMKDPSDGNMKSKPLREWLNLALIGKAMKGDVPALSMIYDRLDGRVPTKITIEGDDSALDAIKQQIREKCPARNDKKN